MKRWPARIALTAAWLGVLVLMASWSDSDAATAGAVIATFAFGAIAGRPWAIVTPFVLIAALLAAAAIAPDGPSDPTEEDGPVQVFFFLAFFGGAAIGLIALGVLARRFVERR